MRIVGSLSIILLISFAAVFMAYGQDEPTSQTTPLPTLPFEGSSLPLPDLAEVNPLYEQLVSEVGFEHPALMMAARQFAQLRDGITFPASNISKSIFRNTEYIFVTFPALSSSGLLLYANENGNISLIIESEAFVYGVMGIADRNGNRLPDFAYHVYYGGNCCPPALLVFEINENGEAVDITPNKPYYDAQEWVDVDDDGIFEIKGISWITPLDSYSYKVTIPHYVLLLTRWYAWNGTAYVDNSAEQIDFCQAEITGPRRKLAHSGCAVYEALTLHQILLDYYAMGRLQQGWQELKPTLGMSHCPSDGDTAMLLNTFQRMVDNNQPWNNGIQTP